VDLSDLGPTTVLIGPNGSGKSNILKAIELVRRLAYDGLESFVTLHGGASFLMHYGPKVTPVVELTLEFATDGGENAYTCRLGYAAGESLIFLEESTGFRRNGKADWRWTSLGAGHRESHLKEASGQDPKVKTIGWLLRHLNFYHFHDTSRSSALRTNARRDDDRYLRSDGSNLAAYLFALKQSQAAEDKGSYERIEHMVARIAPFVRALDPTPVNGAAVRLDWLDDHAETFGPSALSDGTLRAIALFTALGQPVKHLPMFSVIDEPELGLHPAALHLFCELVRSASAHGQVMLATQSPALIDHFEPSEVRVAERIDHATQIGKPLDPQALASWLDDFSLSELYDKNIFGGRP